jgi:pyridinium-3,5-bisthiocarboxylic acid mononucleotide nickel chelatase
MKTLLIDPFSGLAGDMLTAAVIDLGVDQQKFLETLSALNISGCKASIEKIVKNGLVAKKFIVETPEGIEGPDGIFTPNSKYKKLEKPAVKMTIQSDHDHHSHRSLTDVLKIIKGSKLPLKVKEMASKVFTELGKAEAEVHGMTLEDVHFHEVGAADAIYDICGCCLAIDMLGVDQIVCRPIATGGGTVKTAHGILPVPAPATALLLKGIPVFTGPAQRELTTPTGAAIIRALTNQFKDGAEGTLIDTGYGAGTLTFPTHANVVKVTLFENKNTASTSGETDEVNVIQCNIDDMPGEIYSTLIPKLLKNGAIDVTCTPCMMKKNRQGVTLEVLSHDEYFDRIVEILLLDTTTFGLRHHKSQRIKLKREQKSIKTCYGEVMVKCGYWNNKIVKVSPEYDDCHRLSEQLNLPVTQIYAAVHGEAHSLLAKN